MPRPVVALTLAAGLAVIAAGCGESTEETYEHGYKPVNDRILALGEDVGRAVGGASRRRDEQIEKQFGSFAKRMGDLQQDVDELEPPDELKDEQEDLVAAMGDVQGALEDIEKAAADNNPTAAHSATLELVSGSDELGTARRAIARATGAKLD